MKLLKLATIIALASLPVLLLNKLSKPAVKPATESTEGDFDRDLRGE